MKIEKDEITIRDFTETDLPLMFKWLTDKRVLEYYEGRDIRFTMDTLSAHFLEEIPDGFRMIIEYKKSPIGYAQAYQLSGELFDEYDYPDDGHIVFAMDQFIGEPKYWSKGIGSSFLKMMASHLKENMAAERVLLDPHQDNKRAIRAYEKAGFKIIKSLPKHEMFEGEKVDCWLMISTVDSRLFDDAKSICGGEGRSMIILLTGTTPERLFWHKDARKVQISISPLTI